GCVTCGVGTCLLKDIVNIHNLDPGEEAVLLARIAGFIYPGVAVTMPVPENIEKPPAGEINYSPPLKQLVEEHKLIKRWLALIPGFIAGLDVDSENGRGLIARGIDFIRSYADKFHHAKEEDILFKYFDENLDIIRIMLADHQNARAKVREMLAALENRDKDTIATRLIAYRELLTEHIKKEDEVLYRWMDRKLSITEVGELFTRFAARQQEFGDRPEQYEEFIAGMEKIYTTEAKLK
ncbi:MAG: hypothetical protein A2Z15_01860, partial [Chloroflexi bacterium RBG_16_50_11]